MNTSAPPPPPSAPALDFQDILTALSNQTRWHILHQLLAGNNEPLMVLDFAKTLGVPATNISKHINILRRCGILRCGRGNLYSVLPHLLVPGQPFALDLGAVLLRLDRMSNT